MQAAADYALIAEGIRAACFACVRLCDDKAICEINTRERNVNHATDVLSFPTVRYPAGFSAGSCEKLLKQEYDDETGCCFLGDIVISVPHLYAQAEEYGHSVEREATYLLVHGICHLMGYDHMEDEDKKRMRTMEEKILSNV
jgi:probable rRNA maturation factor